VAGDSVFASIFSPGAVCAAKRTTGEILWFVKFDSLGSGSVILQGRNLYANSNRTLYALDPKTGRARWTFSPISDNGEWIYSSPSVRGKRVFIGDRCGYFHCLDAVTGKTLWRRLTSMGKNNQVNSTALALRDRVITANNQGVVVCYAIETGKTMWRRKLDGPCVIELLRYGSKVIVATDSLYAIKLSSGAIDGTWTFPLQTVKSVEVVDFRIALVLGTDFVSQPAAWNKASAFNGDLVILEGGQEVARTKLKGTPTIRASKENGHLYCVSPWGMQVIDPAGASILSFQQRQIGAPAISEGQLYGLTEEGALFSEPVP